MTTNRISSARHKFLRTAAWIMGSLFTLLLLTLAGAAWWLWSWKWNDALNFHESWSAEEQAALTEFNIYMQDKLAEDMGMAAVLDENENSLITRILADIALRIAVAPINSALHEVAESGKGDPETMVSTPLGSTTPAILATQIGHISALKALINHGANPNAVVRNPKEDEAESMFSPLLSGRFINNQKMAWEERRVALDFLVQRGGDINNGNKINSLSLQMALILEEDERPWHWALDNGKKVNIKDFCSMLDHALPSGANIIERILKEKRVDVNDVGDKRTALQTLAQAMCYAEVEELEQGYYENVLELLLAAGANPNLTTDNSASTPIQILERRTNFERADGMPENSCCLTGPDIRTRWRNICDKLRAASAYSATVAPTDSEEDETEYTDEEDEEEYSDEEEEEEPEIEIN